MVTTKTYRIDRNKAISETLDGETIIINLETGTYYSMNASGTTVWDALGKELPINVTESFVTDFLVFLERENLIANLSESESELSACFTANEKPVIEKYSDMQEMLLADPIHDVDTAGWPKMKDVE